MDINALIATAVETEDQTEVHSGGDFEYTPPAPGKTPMRFVGYIELGKRAQTFKGEKKPDADEVRMIFELFGKDRVKDIEVEGGTKKVAERIEFNITKKLTEKSKYVALFNAMRAGRDDIKHMAQMLGEAFMGEVFHYVKNKGTQNERVYANLYDDKNVYSVKAPRVSVPVDPLNPVEFKDVDISKNVPAAISAIKVFFWNNPTPETWDSLFIDGHKETKNADGTVTQVSKNWLQEYIMSATNYQNSPLAMMLGGVADLKIEEKKEEIKVSTGSLPAEQKASVAEVDALAALGLT